MTDFIHSHHSPASASSVSTSPDGSNDTDMTSASIGTHGNESMHNLVKTESTTSEGSAFVAPKADKPRPHICGTCARTFARLEHLKRHERSHTKEKPFECPECTRCFARRDLLLRHQQKLHLTTTPSTRAKPVRRESTSGVSTTSARVRKNSVANNNNTNGATSTTGAARRQRANTLGHIDVSALGLSSGIDQSSPNSLQSATPLSGQFNIVNHFNGAPNAMSLQRQAAANSRGHSRSQTMSHLPQLGYDSSWRHSLPTVPSQIAMNNMYDFSEIANGAPTVNPQQLHLDESIDSLDSPFVESFEWMGGFNPYMGMGYYNEQNLPIATPGVGHSQSPMLPADDSGYNSSGFFPHQNSIIWSPHVQQLQTPDHSQMSPDLMTHMQTDYGVPIDMSTGLQHNNHDHESIYPTPPPFASLSPDPSNNIPQYCQQPMQYSEEAVDIPIDPAFNAAQYQAWPSSIDSITEVTRQALLTSLTQPSLGPRKYSQPNMSSSTSSRDNSKSTKNVLPDLPDLKRYVAAYILYFQPHYPFLHTATLSFDSPAYTNNLRVSPALGLGGIVGGGGCLILAMAAIGALYEYEPVASKELFDSARKMIQLYLEERRKADLAAAINSSRQHDSSTQNTPLWLVQAMLLNVIYGHQCGDKMSGDIASTHCAALVSLGRAADLLNPAPDFYNNTMECQLPNGQATPDLEHVRTNDSLNFNDPWGFGAPTDEEEMTWRNWVVAEERKRTLYALFNMSSLLVSGYNHSPAIMNSEIHLDLPCDESLWSAESAGIWLARGGAQAARQNAIPFSAALSRLLLASQSQIHQQANMTGRSSGSSMLMTDLPPSDLKPSTFGCLVLINALHNFVWETRQRHSGRRWTTQETELMQANIEPALRAWQAAWASNPTHSVERPNPFGMGPLSADSIPLLDLAYVRLFVNLGLSKEAFWQRDYDAMSEELARGTDIIQHADYSSSASQSGSSDDGSPKASLTDNMDIKMALSTAMAVSAQNSTKRERQLRKAAFYAADSLSMSQKLGVTFADFSSRDLPMQSAMCTFDCAQVLAEWVTTVQERVGRYLGIMGRDAIDFTQVPAILLLEDEDCKLLDKTRDILAAAETKMTNELGNVDPQAAMAIMNVLPSCSNRGYGSQILGVTAFTLRKAAVWPVTTLMAHALEVQAAHTQKRADQSVVVAQA